MSASPPAAWYPDPTTPGLQRYWDGARWTEHTAPAAGAAGAAGPRGPLPALAGFGPRLAAALLDGLLLSIPAVVLFAVLALLVFGLGGATLGNLDDPGAAGAAGAGLAVGLLVMVGVLFVVFTVGPILYAVGYEGGPTGQTPGKWMMGIRVVDGRTAGRLERGRALVRVLVRSFASGFLALGYLWMLWDDQDRTWHDMAADSRVVVATGPRGSFGDAVRAFSLRG